MCLVIVLRPLSLITRIDALLVRCKLWNNFLAKLYIFLCLRKVMIHSFLNYTHIYLAGNAHQGDMLVLGYKSLIVGILYSCNTDGLRHKLDLADNYSCYR